MIINFYKRLSGANRYIKFAVKDIDFIPQVSMYTTISGQSFIISKVIYNVDTHDYDVYLVRQK